MLIANGSNQNGDRSVLVLGMTAENVERLMRGQPIYLRPETHPGLPPGWEVLIVYGPDEKILLKKLQQPGTEVRRDDRLEDPPRDT